MAEFIMVACDLHDKTMVLKIAVGREPSEKLTVANTVAKRRWMIEQLHARSQAAGGASVIFAYEASGQGFGLYDELTAANIRCHVLAPTKIPHSIQRRSQKTDERDAEDILQLLRGHVLAGNALPTVWVPDAQTRSDRDLVRARLDVADKCAAIKVQIKCLLKRNKLIRPEHLKGAWSKKASIWLWLLTKDVQVGEGTREGLASLLRQWEFYQEELDRLDERMAELSRTKRYAVQLNELVKLQGVAMLTAMVFLTEMGDLRRFSNRRQIGAYLGLVPRCFESGAAGDRKGHITRQGQSQVRRVLCQAAWARVREKGCDHEAYQRLVTKNPKHKKIAIVATMRRLGIRMWHRTLAAEAETGPTPGASPTAHARSSDG